MDKIKTLPPFKRFCMTIGQLPSSYLESMSYAECIVWLCNYLKETVVPAVNENAEAVNDLINWFNNLDVQEEVNNKLDEMAESGELEEIIASYLNTNAIIGFNTKAEMLASENLVNGSFARTLGNTNYLAGDGNLYKIREITNEDVIDNDNITPLTNSETLIAEKIPYTNNKSLQEQITANTNKLNLTTNKKVIMIGDSYANRDNSWQDRIKTYAGLTSSNSVLNRKSGAGFVASPDGVNFITMLTQNVTFNPNEVTDIIVCGGLNDRFHTTTELSTAISNFISTARTTYPNAEIYLGFISWVSADFENYSSTVGTIYNMCNAWKRAAMNGLHVHYLNNVEYSLHNTENFDESFAHPIAAGQELIAQNVMQAWNTGSCDVEQSDAFGIVATTTGNITAVSGQFIGGISNGISYIKTQGVVGITFNSTSFSLGSTIIEVGKFNGGFLMGRTNLCSTNVGVVLNTTNHGYMKVPCDVYVNEGKLYLKFQVAESSGWITDRVTQCTLNQFSIFGSSMQQY